MHWLGQLLRALSFLRLVWPKILELVEYIKKTSRERRLRKAFRDAKKNGDTSTIEQFLVSGGLSDKSKDKSKRKSKDPSDRPQR